MFSSKLYLMCNRTAKLNLVYRQIQTNSTLLSRPTSHSTTKLKEFGVRHRRKLYEDNDEFLEVSEDQDDLEPDTLDYMNLDKAYDDNIRERAALRRKQVQAITKSKFFSVSRQPHMLTYEDRENIKFLHKQDPKQWNIHSLSESFPALPHVISNILRSKWKPSPEKIKKMDSVVQKNWELLEKGELEADPKHIKHLKKFLNRKRVKFQHAESSNFCLSEPKEEYNNSEMSKIITNFENEIKKLEEIDRLRPNNLLTDGSQEGEKMPNNSSNTKGNLDKLHEKIKKEVSERGLKRKESFILGQAINAINKQMTFEELQESIVRKKNDNKNLDLSEKVFLEHKLGLSQNYSNDEGFKTCKSSIHEKLSQKETQNSQESLINNETENLKNCHISENEEESRNKTEHYNDEKMSKDFVRNVKSKIKKDADEDYKFSIDNKTKFILSESDLGKTFNESEMRLEKEETKIIKPKRIIKEEVDVDPEKVEREKKFFSDQVKDIENTFFWNNNKDNKSKHLSAIQQSSVTQLKDLENIKKSSDFAIDSYPERIKIPKGHRRSGLTFKVKDCYYDDDGEFLYRVPGMSK